MQAKMIEETLKKIIEIDKKSIEVETLAIKSERDKYDALKKLKKDMEFSVMKQARKEAKGKYDAIMNQAREAASAIEKKGDEECERLNRLLEENKEEMVEKVFIRLFEVVMSQSKDLE